MNTDLSKRLTIKLSNDREVSLLFVRPTTTANWVCQTTDECLTDLAILFENEIVHSK